MGGKDVETVIALTIWWCEGSKLRKDKRWKNAYLYPIEVINTDPQILLIFANFLRRLGVEETKFRGQIQIHEGDNKNEIENYWSTYLNIPISQFNKTIVRPKGNMIKKPNMYGTFKLRTYSKPLFLKLEGMLNAYISECSAVG